MNTRAIAIAVGALAVTAGCGSGGSGGPGSVANTGTPLPHTSSPLPTGSATTTSSATPTATDTSSSPTSSLPRCVSSQLSLALGNGQGAAGTTYTPLVFTNSASKACELNGYPGVSFVDASGNLLGKPAGEDTGKVKPIKLSSGGSGYALLRQPNPGNYDPSACQQTTADRIRVYPPGERTPLFVHDPTAVCTTGAGRPGVRPVASGTGG